MKPRLLKSLKTGRWLCFMESGPYWQLTGIGNTPEQAYSDWLCLVGRKDNDDRIESN